MMLLVLLILLWRAQKHMQMARMLLFRLLRLPQTLLLPLLRLPMIKLLRVPITRLPAETAAISAASEKTVTPSWANEARTASDGSAMATHSGATPPAEMMQLSPIPVLGGQADTVDIAVDMPQSLLLKKGTESTVSPSAELSVDLEAPVHAGQVVGTWRLKNGDETLCEYAVRATTDVPAKTFRYAYSLLVAVLLE